MDELREFYDGYIAAFNGRDEPTFASCFHLPVTVFRLPTDERTAPPPVVVTSMADLWPVLPAKWTHSVVDEFHVVGDPTDYTPRAPFEDRSSRRPVLQVTVTRWAGEVPYEQVHVLYVLATLDGRLGIVAMVPLAVAGARAAD